jgi:hypothetical protein
MINVDKNIAMPAKKTTNKYPWLKMDVGDSFYVDIPLSRRPGICSGMNITKAPKHWVVRKDGEGLRVWRDA